MEVKEKKTLEGRLITVLLNPGLFYFAVKLKDADGRALLITAVSLPACHATNCTPSPTRSTTPCSGDAASAARSLIVINTGPLTTPARSSSRTKPLTTLPPPSPSPCPAASVFMEYVTFPNRVGASVIPNASLCSKYHRLGAPRATCTTGASISSETNIHRTQYLVNSTTAFGTEKSARTSKPTHTHVSTTGALVGYHPKRIYAGIYMYIHILRSIYIYRGRVSIYKINPFDELNTYGVGVFFRYVR